MERIVRVLNVGRLSYGEALKVQQYLANNHFNKIHHDISDILVIVEHNPVYTIGIRTKGYTSEDEKRLTNLGAEFFKTNRGGLITFHGPGQLVAYPIVNLKNFKPSMRWYVSTIEQTIIDMCSELNLRANTSPHTGVWIGDNKVCAIGVHGRKYVTTHGLALNCNVDLKWYDHIVPCGIEDKGVTSLSKELNTEYTVQDALPLFLNSFKKLFNCNLLYLNNDVHTKIMENIN
ncbi:putative lipoyltransferase 2, mitochondrial [Chrysoperla carnea]|uniref:putative lipoyltransferase 2, mitochondrial n=1 Tax=Chrysoperla carnea TaxID=189513 RepID=UPI001D06E756|nr:putative lipoyltransferase 2, mitochondrial [Chrysoperla carnea]